MLSPAGSKLIPNGHSLHMRLVRLGAVRAPGAPPNLSKLHCLWEAAKCEAAHLAGADCREILGAGGRRGRCGRLPLSWLKVAASQRAGRFMVRIPLAQSKAPMAEHGPKDFSAKDESVQ